MPRTKYRKQRPAMPQKWHCAYDACIRCKNRNGCSSCKFAKQALKENKHKKEKGRNTKLKY